MLRWAPNSLMPKDFQAFASCSTSIYSFRLVKFLQEKADVHSNSYSPFRFPWLFLWMNQSSKDSWCWGCKRPNCAVAQRPCWLLRSLILCTPLRAGLSHPWHEEGQLNFQFSLFLFEKLFYRKRGASIHSKSIYELPEVLCIAICVKITSEAIFIKSVIYKNQISHLL